MKHAGPETLAKIKPLLARLRGMPELKEKTPGTFYFKSRAFLHFHEDPAGLYADIRAEDGRAFERLHVVGRAGEDALIAAAAARTSPKRVSED